MQTNLIRCAGWLFWMLSIMLVAWGGGPFSFASFPAETFLFNTVRLLAFTLVFFVSAAAARRMSPSLSPSSTCIVAATLLILCALPGMLPISAPIIVMLTAALLGIAASIMFVLWQQEYALVGSYSACIILALASGLAALFVLFLFDFARLDSRELLSPLFCLFSCILFFYLQHQRSEPTPQPNRIPSFRDFTLRFWHQIICVAAFAFIWEFVLALGAKLYSPLEMLQVSAWTQILASLVLVAVWVIRKGHFGIEKLFTISFPIAATGFLLMPFLGAPFQLIVVCLVALLFSIASVLMQVTCIREFEKNGSNPVYVFGLFAGIVYGCMTIGFFAGRFLDVFDEFSLTHLLVIALALVYGLSLIAFLLQSNKRKATHTDRSSKEDAEKAPPEDGSERSLQEACSALSGSFGLSGRESEVLLLLARGRNLPYISEALFISKNTVRTHLKNIYQKLNVHDRQELLDLIEKEQT